jgi:NAD(P)-dependent dehydrogenase (short-subunit alcohol dehydrogenase family)
MIGLSGRLAIVTGAGGGLGREHAFILARHGAKVLVKFDQVRCDKAVVGVSFINPKV